MGCNNPPALSAPAEGHEECSLASKLSFEADLMSTTLPSYTHSDLKDTRELSPQVSKNEDNRSASHMDIDCSAASVTDANLVNVTTNGSVFPKGPELSCSHLNLKNFCHGFDENNNMTADCLRNSSMYSTNYQGSGGEMNIMQQTSRRGDIIRGNPVKTCVAEAETGSINRLEMSGNFTSTGYSASLMPVSGVVGTNGTKDGLNIVPLQFRSPVRVDESFLNIGVDGTGIRSNDNSSGVLTSKLPTLAIGDGTGLRSNRNFSSKEIASKLEIRSNRKFSTQEIASKLKETFHSQFVGRILKDSTDITPLTRKGARSETNGAEFSISASDLVGGVSSMQFPVRNLTVSSPSESMFVSRPECVTSSELVSEPIMPGSSASYTGSFLLDEITSSFPCGDMEISHSENVNLSMGSQPAKPTILASQSTSNLTRDDFKWTSITGFSDHPLSVWNRGSSINHAQLGSLTPFAEGSMAKVAKIGPGPRSVQPDGHPFPYHNVSTSGAIGNHSFSERIGFQGSTGVKFHSEVGGSFPKRLGLQPNYSGPLKISEGNLHKMQSGGLVDHLEEPAKHPFAIGLPPSHLPIQDNSFSPLVTTGHFPAHLAAPANPYRPSVPSGQQHPVMPTQFSKFPPRAEHSIGPVIPVTKIDSRRQPFPVMQYSSMKRKAAEMSAPLRLGPRRKTIPDPVLTEQRPSIPATFPAMALVPTAPLHIKWNGFEDPPTLTGEKCLLCKRDLSFTAEGPMYRPTALPTVAILPCGHTFHDHCLQTISLEDQAKNPPCIPCAIGET